MIINSKFVGKMTVILPLVDIENTYSTNSLCILLTKYFILKLKWGK